jgi:hypothetical protein
MYQGRGRTDRVDTRLQLIEDTLQCISDRLFLLVLGRHRNLVHRLGLQPAHPQQECERERMVRDPSV